MSGTVLSPQSPLLLVLFLLLLPLSGGQRRRRHAALVRHAAAAVVVARIYKKSKKISDDHVCRHFTHSSLSLSKLSALCGKLKQRQNILFRNKNFTKVPH
jgi:hypothetical protein